MGLTGPGRPEKTAGRSGCRITGETTAAHADFISAIDSARLPFLPDGTGRLPGELMLRRGAQPGGVFRAEVSWRARARNCPSRIPAS
jgi:hypothetical protein